MGTAKNKKKEIKSLHAHMYFQNNRFTFKKIPPPPPVLQSCQVRFRGAKVQNGGKPPQNRPSPAQNRSESKFSYIFQQPMNRDKFAYIVLWAK